MLTQAVKDSVVEKYINLYFPLGALEVEPILVMLLVVMVDWEVLGLVVGEVVPAELPAVVVPAETVGLDLLLYIAGNLC
jgi:hypothetical protein